jgi:hypothetical protein
MIKKFVLKNKPIKKIQKPKWGKKKRVGEKKKKKGKIW